MNLLLTATAASCAAGSRTESGRAMPGVFEPGPTPDAAAEIANGDAAMATRTVARMTRRAVLDEPRMSVNHVTHEGRLVEWLAANGFERLDGYAVARWMRARSQAGDSYGSVVVLPRGVCPSTLLEGEPPLWLDYVGGGGRIVNIGDLPFYTVESPTVAPMPFAREGRGLDVTGLEVGWSSRFWGRSLPIAATRAASEWGITGLDSSITGFGVDSISIAFSQFTLPQSGEQGAGSWFKNFRPEFPWSGVVKIRQWFDGNDDDALRDAWNAAHFVGQRLAPPPVPSIDAPRSDSLLVTLSAGGSSERSEFVRGEDVAIRATVDPSLGAERVRMRLRHDDAVVLDAEHALDMPFVLHTLHYRTGSYRLELVALADGSPVATHSQEIGIRHVPSRAFHFAMATEPSANPTRAALELGDIHDAGMDVHFVAEHAAVDAATRAGVGFSLRADPGLAGQVAHDFGTQPELFRLGPDGAPLLSAGRPMLGISHPSLLSIARRAMAEAVRPVVRHPGFRRSVLTNDDFSTVYGWDYSPHVLAAFRSRTGLEAPREMSVPPAGVVSDADAWLRWLEYTTRDISGALNRAQMRGAVGACPECRVGPIPGGMTVPLVSMWDGAQYPPFNFGRNGFNLISSYYYNSYWQPLLATTFWMEVGRMGNRDLDEWNMPDALHTQLYTRNSFFLYLAGGAKGLVYFRYPQRTEAAWSELARLSDVARRVGDVQAMAVSGPRQVALLDSFTTVAFRPTHTIELFYAYANLVSSHYDVDVVSEEELLGHRADPYSAVLLQGVRWLRRSVFDALVARIRRGGLVLLSADIPFDIPGARRLPLDIGTAATSHAGRPGDAAEVPSLRDYGDPAHIRAIGEALAPYVRSHVRADPTLISTSLRAGTLPLRWFVAVHDGTGFSSCRSALLDTPGDLTRLRAWERREEEKGPAVVHPTLDTLPGIPYDISRGERVEVHDGPDGHTLTLELDPLGGALVAFYSDELASISLTGPAQAKAQHELTLLARVAGVSGPIREVVEVEFVLRDPRGGASELSGVRVTRDGVASFEWTPALNDPLGTWTLEATELASGKHAAFQIALR